VEWGTVDNELQLLQILCGTRPIGNKRNVWKWRRFSTLVSQQV
jgi:hypothetical protein